MRDTVKVMVGGAPVDAEFGKRVGADGYGSNAPAGSELAQKFRRGLSKGDHDHAES